MARRHRRNEEHENHERWLVSYADFITLLFAFFVVMYATSTANEEKQQKFENSIKMELRLSGGGGESHPNSIQEAMMELDMPLGKFPTKGGSGEAEDYVQRALEKSMGKDEKKKSIQEIYSDAVGVRIALAAATFFPSGSAKLKMSSLGALDKVAEILKSTDKRVIIEGHTDDTPIEGEMYPSNWELAAARSSAVIRYLVKYHKLESKRFISLSYGDQKPIVPNDTEEHRSQNRRIEVFIVTDDKKAEI